MKSYLKLYEGVYITQGFKNTIIQDSFHQKLVSITCEINLADYFTFDAKSIKNYNNSLAEYLVENGFAYYTNTCEKLPGISKKQKDESTVSNAIISIDKPSVSFLVDLVEQLDHLGCESLELRILDYSINLKDLFLSLSKSKIVSVYLILSCPSNSFLKTLIELANGFNRVQKVFVFNFDSTNFDFHSEKIIFKEGNASKIGCGMISKFIINNRFIEESREKNNCLYMKISIDSNGDIKNCPSMTESFGNIADTTLAEAIEKPGFKKYWNINKDKIHVCKDCEFRYICTDCRAYVEDPADILSKPLKCGYNPYTVEWSEWSTNPLKQKAIDFYGMREMVNSKHS